MRDLDVRARICSRTVQKNADLSDCRIRATRPRTTWEDLAIKAPAVIATRQSVGPGMTSHLAQVCVQFLSLERYSTYINVHRHLQSGPGVFNRTHFRKASAYSV